MAGSGTRVVSEGVCGAGAAGSSAPNARPMTVADHEKDSAAQGGTEQRERGPVTVKQGTLSPQGETLPEGQQKVGKNGWTLVRDQSGQQDQSGQHWLAAQHLSLSPELTSEDEKRLQCTAGRLQRVEEYTSNDSWREALFAAASAGQKALVEDLLAHWGMSPVDFCGNIQGDRWVDSKDVR